MTEKTKIKVYKAETPIEEKDSTATASFFIDGTKFVLANDLGKESDEQ